MPKTETSIRISPDLDPLPLTAVTQKFAALGISGSGKTYGAGKFVECLLDARAQVVVVDTIGNWGQGLRLAADGRKPGFAIPILGGEHGDVPLDAGHGELVAATVVDTLSPLVLDVSDFTKGELGRFVTDFATELLRRKKRSKTPVMVVWEECQDIVPQVVRGDKARMVGAVEALIKKGRNYGVGTMLISQRAAAVNKDVLNQIETLFAFRQNSKHDRNAVRDWVVSQAIDVTNLADQLPTLKTGECFCWSPSWLGVLEKIKFGTKRTFDASRTPDARDYVPPGKLAPVDLDAFRATMQDAIERAKADDPKALRKRIVQLEQQLATAAAAAAEPERVPVFDEMTFAAITGRIDARLAAGHEKVLRELSEYRERLVGSGAPISAHAPAVTRPKPAEQLRKSAVTSAQTRPVTNGAGDPRVGNTGLRRMLIALAQRPGGLTASQLALRTGISKRGGTFRTYVGRGKTEGWIDGNASGMRITPEGLQALGSYEPLPEGRALADYWLAELGESGASRMLAATIAAYPNGLTNHELSEQTGIAAAGGTFRTYLGKLRTLELVEKTVGGSVTASSELF